MSKTNLLINIKSSILTRFNKYKNQSVNTRLLNPLIILNIL